MRRHGIGGSPWLIALALGAVVLAGAICLPMPFWGDQALFTVYGRELTQGSVLYRDVFDVKQPGIFVFYALGGLLFGFSEVGIHLFELIYWLGFSWFSIVALRRYFTTPWGSALVPVCTVVVYYLYAGVLDLTQIEILVAFPILLAWWLIDRADPRTREGLKRYAAAGLAAAAVVLLKHLYLLIVLAFLVAALLRARRAGIPSVDIRRSLIAFTVAFLMPLSIVVVYFAVHGQLGRIWWAYMEMAPSAQLGTSKPISYLITGSRRFLIGHAPVLVLAVLGAAQALRERTRPQLDLVVGMLLTGAAGAVAFLIQGWPEYKWSLFTVPLGVLAVVGVEGLVAAAVGIGRKAGAVVVGIGAVVGLASFVLGAAPQTQTLLLVFVVIGAGTGVAVVVASQPWLRRGALKVVTVALAACVAVAALAPVDKVRLLVRHDFALSVHAREELRASWHAPYRDADLDLATLASGQVYPGPMYVFGHPVLLLRAKRRQAAPILGWGPEFLDDRAWREIADDLSSTVPPYIVVDPRLSPLVRRRAPELFDWIERRYDVAFIGASGTWYVRR